MLRITRYDKPGQRVVLRLEGRLVAQWADLLERECSALLESFAQVDIELCGVVVLDRAGIAALERLHHAGVAIQECPEVIADILENDGIPVQGTRDVP